MFKIDRRDYLFISISSSDESELGANDGWATASIQGGTAPYNFLWSTEETTDTIIQIAQGLQKAHDKGEKAFKKAEFVTVLKHLTGKCLAFLQFICQSFN